MSRRTSSRVTARLCSGLLAGTVALLGCSNGDDTEPSEMGPADQGVHHHSEPSAEEDRWSVTPHSAKHAELLQIARAIRRSDEMYFGEAIWKSLQRADTTGMTEQQLAELHYTRGRQAFKLGEVEQARESFSKCLSYINSPVAKYMLGVTELRIGELDNCIHHHSAESCILPIAGGGIHARPAGAESALQTMLELVNACPREMRPKVRWFANLSAMALGRHPGELESNVLIAPERFASPHDIGRFPDIAMELGIAPMNLAGGSCIDDFDGDGLLDIVTSTADLVGQMRYYRNEGDGSFSDRTREAGLLGQVGGLNMLHADYDDDGDRDLLVLRGGWMGTYGQIPNSLLRNRGNGTFEDVTSSSGIGETSYPCQAAGFADYDLDGDLDLFLGNETPPPASGLQYPCQLFRNDGSGRFHDVTEEAGVQNFKLTKGVAWGDFDGDRDPDLFCSHQYDKNRLYRNEGDGTFSEIAAELGVDEPTLSFPTWFWDYDNDGQLDLFVGGYGGDVGEVAKSVLRPERKADLNALYKNVDGNFRDVARDAGLHSQALVMGANFGDLDNDGFLDFYLGTGAPEFDALVPNLMYRNDGKGGFQDVTTSGGFGNLQKGHGIAFGDLDNDGDQDIYLQSGGIYPYDGYFNSLFLNPGHGNRWITLELVGVTSNRDAIGSRVHVRFVDSGRKRDVYRWIGPSGSFGSSSFQEEIGLGQASAIEFVEVYWPVTDTTQRFRGLEMDSFYRITEGQDEVERVRRRKVPLRALASH